MTLKDAGQRLSWRFTSGKPFTPNQNDIDALNRLFEAITQMQYSVRDDHSSFAKLYAYTLRHEIEYYKDFDFAIKRMNEVLQTPCEMHYDEVRNALNRLAILTFAKKVGISETPRYFKTDEEHEADRELLKSHPEAEIYLKGIFSKNKIDTNLNVQITESLNKYRNIP